jgi:hypothetical protein
MVYPHRPCRQEFYLLTCQVHQRLPTYGPWSAKALLVIREGLHQLYIFPCLIFPFSDLRKHCGSENRSIFFTDFSVFFFHIRRVLINLWLYKENKLRVLKKYIYSTYSPPELHTHLWLRCSNSFNPSKKNYFGFAPNRKVQRLISTPTYKKNGFCNTICLMSVYMC